MSEDKYLNKYRNSSARASWHDYNSGVYFVTICTHNREHFFGEIVGNITPVGTRDFNNVGTRNFDNVGTRCTTSLRGEPQMILSVIGQYAHDQFANVTTHYPYAEIPLFVIMPDHIHAIVVVDGNKTPYQRRHGTDNGNCRDAVPSDICRDAISMDNCGDAISMDNCGDAISMDNCRDAVHHVPTMREIANMQGWLSVVIGGLKRAITRYAHENNIPFAWQTRFHDRIVRNQGEMNRIATYIEQNIANWWLHL